MFCDFNINISVAYFFCSYKLQHIFLRNLTWPSLWMKRPYTGPQIQAWTCVSVAALFILCQMFTGSGCGAKTLRKYVSCSLRCLVQLQRITVCGCTAVVEHVLLWWACCRMWMRGKHGGKRTSSWRRWGFLSIPKNKNRKRTFLNSPVKICRRGGGGGGGGASEVNQRLEWERGRPPLRGEWVRRLMVSSSSLNHHHPSPPPPPLWFTASHTAAAQTAITYIKWSLRSLCTFLSRSPGEQKHVIFHLKSPWNWSHSD